MKPTAIIVNGLGFGDEGKGSVVDALVRRYNAHTVVRYSGGSEGTHRVISPDGQAWVFRQFSSGTLVPGTRTFLTSDCYFDPSELLSEARQIATHIGIENPMALFCVDEDCVLTTSFHSIMCRLHELARKPDERHGTRGVGVGETARLKPQIEKLPLAKHLRNPDELEKRVRFVQETFIRRSSDVVNAMTKEVLDSEIVQTLLDLLYSQETFENLLDDYALVGKSIAVLSARDIQRQFKQGTIILEGNGGVLLDQDFGFYPHNTWSRTTPQNAWEFLHGIEFPGRPVILGVTRSYTTRHGTGILPTEDESLTSFLPEEANVPSYWQGTFRSGYLDMSLLRYAVHVGIRYDALAITHLDRIPQEGDWKVATEYRTKDDVLLDIRPKIGQERRSSQMRALADQIANCDTVYRNAPRDPETFAAWISTQLNVKLGVLSFGRRATDKEFTPYWNELMGGGEAYVGSTVQSRGSGQGLVSTAS